MNYWDILGLAPTKDLGPFAVLMPPQRPNITRRTIRKSFWRYARPTSSYGIRPRSGAFGCHPGMDRPTAAMFGEDRPAGTQLRRRRLYAPGRVPDGRSFYIPGAGLFYAAVPLQTAPRS